MRWGHAMIRPTPGFLWGRDRRIPIFEESLWHGVRAAGEVMMQVLHRS